MMRELVVFLSFTSMVLAALQFAALQTKPDEFKDVEGCYVEDLHEVIPTAGSAPSKSQCMEYRCGTAYLQIETCGAVAAEPPCKLVEDRSKLFPDCCPTIECPLSK